MMTTKRAGVIAAIIAFAYILVQSFQSYVFAVLSPVHSPVEEFLQNSLGLHL